MSLNFVKSAVLSSTDGVSHNEETTINNAETTSLRKNATHQPLFEQLRANKEAEQEKNDEFQKSLRGTRALDEEDCAHLDSVERVREERENEVRSGIEREVALFRAARVDRGLTVTINEEGGVGGGDRGEGAVETEEDTTEKKNKIIPAKKAMVPKFTIKKKRKQAPTTTDKTKQNADNADDTTMKSKAEDDSNSTEQNKATNSKGGSCSNAVGGLLGLGCYGSDSDSD